MRPALPVGIPRARALQRAIYDLNSSAKLPARQNSRSSHRINVAVHAIPHAPLPLPSVLRPPCITARTQRFSLSCRTSHGAFLFLLQGSNPFLGRPFFLSTCIALRRARRPHARTFASPRTDDRRTNDATCGPQEWLTGSLHDGGIRSVRSPLRRAPLLATPIATPLQCGRPERSGLLVS